MLKRVTLFVLTNLAVMLVLGVVMALLSASGVLAGIDQYYVSLLVFAALFGFGGAIVSLLISKPMAKWSTGAKVISQPRSEVESWLLMTVRAHAQRAGIRPPEVAIYDSPDMNAFATGATRNSALVAVSTGLLGGMDRDEVEAVIGHEISHAANGDMVTLALLQGILNTFVLFASRVIGDIVDKTVFRTERGGRGPAYLLVTLFAQFLLGILATIVVMWFSRWREFRADAGAASLVGAPKMVSALRRLQRSVPSHLPEAVRAFGIRDGQRGLASLFRSHPPLEERIAALQAGSQQLAGAGRVAHSR